MLHVSRCRAVGSSLRNMSSGPLEWLASLQNWEQQGVPDGAGVKGGASAFELDRMHRLLRDMNSPHMHCGAVIHVGGTKGKGSTAAMIASIARQAGRRTGLYTSPHVRTIHERIVVDGAQITPAELDALIDRWRPAIEAARAREGGALSHFETLTALALAHFAARGVEVGVVEVGLGGATDATNVFDEETLAAAVVVPVGEDHLGALGGSLESISRAKAGIFKSQRPAVIARQSHKQAHSILTSQANDINSVLVDVTSVTCSGEAPRLEWTLPMEADAPSPPKPWKDSRAQLVTRASLLLANPVASWLGMAPDTRLDVFLKLTGAHQAENAATAVCAIACLARYAKGSQMNLDQSAIIGGLAQASLIGRFQVVRVAADGTRSSLLVFDGAHTPESAKALAEALRAAFPGAPLALVLACASDKNLQGICKELQSLLPQSATFTSTEVAGSRARSANPGQLARAWQLEADDAPRKLLCRESVQSSVGAAMDHARREAGSEGVVVVTGSLHAVGEGLKVASLD